MEINPTMTPQDRLEALLQENLELSKSIFKSAEKTRRYILWGQILGWVKVFIILVPIVLGYLYLQPYLKSAIATYQDLFGVGVTPSNKNSETIDPALLKKYQELQKSGKLNELQQLLR